ncbi:hypothetical protein ACVIWU_006687 [Bradyrhizobium sp. USDA 4509]
MRCGCQGKILKEATVASELDALVEFVETLGFAVERIELEAEPQSQWLHAGLKRAGFETVLLETRHVKAALSAMTGKTDRKDARGIAQPDGMAPAGTAKSVDAQEIRALLIGRKQLLGRLIDVELSIRGIFAWLWAEGWPGDAEEVRSADPKVSCGSGDIGAYCRGDAFGTIGLEGRVRKVTQGCAGSCA